MYAKTNAKLINADQIVKELSKCGEQYYRDIVKQFGEEILLENKEINRPKLAQIIFNDTQRRKELNKLTSMHIAKKIQEEAIKEEQSVTIIDAPLLIETKLNEICDIVVSVVASEDTKIKRICKRDSIDEKTAKQRLKSQLAEDIYIENSNYILTNDKANLEKEVEEFWKMLNNQNLFNKETVIIKNENIKYMQFKKLLKYKNIKHCFTLKPTDVGSNDTYRAMKNIADKNYKDICNLLKLDSSNIVRPYQTHTNNVKKITNEIGIFPEKLQDVDGLITRENNKILSLTFADCTPIYLYDKQKNIIGNIHSGWQGTVKKIAKYAIIKMKKEFNSDPKDIVCVIGPTIRKCHFEVQKDVKDIFYNTFKYMKNIDKIIEFNKNTNSYFIDTVEINKELLKEEGILEENIVDSGICTYCNSNIIHSYRKEGKEAGRNTTLICIK